MSKNISPAELYAVEFQNTEPKFYTRIPNIIDYLTYTVEEKGKKITKRLSVYAKELYRVLRMIASEDGACWCSTETLADRIGCSVGSIVNAKRELLMPMDQLDGSALIIETKKTVQKKTSDGKKFATVVCTRVIIDIWRWNNAFMATLKYHRPNTNVHKPEAYSCDEYPDPPYSPDELASPVTDSCGEANKKQKNKNHLFKEQQPAADAASVCLSKKRERMFFSKEQKAAYLWMIENKCDEASAFEMASKFTPDEIHQASKYLLDQEKKNKAKNKKIDNRWGYFRQTLNRRFWENV